MDDVGDSGKRLAFLFFLFVSPSLPHTSISNGAFLLFPDGGNLLSVDGEAQDQGKAEVKGSVSQKKAITTLKVTGCCKRGFCSDSGRAVTEALAFQIYNSSLEEEFNHFEDWLNVFPLYRGQGGQDGDGEEEGSGNLVGKFKVCFGKEWGTREHKWGCRKKTVLPVFFLLHTPPSHPGLLPHLP